MDNRIRFVADLLVLVLVAFPPFLYLYQYLHDKVRNFMLKILIYIIYWGGTVVASNLIPASTVLFLIWKSKKENAVDTIDFETEGSRVVERSFRLDCSDAKWAFSIKTFIKFSVLGVLIKFFVTYVNLIVVEILNKYNIILENQEIIGEFLKSTLWKSAVFFVIIVICAPIVEEFVFRFWIYDRILKKKVNTLLSAILSSLLFMAAHFNVQGAIAFFLIGVINCYLYDKKGYWAAVANHFMFNFITVVLLIIVKVFNIPLEA